MRAGEGSRTGSPRGDRGPHAPGPTHSGSRGRDRSSVSYTAPQDEEYGAWAVGFRTCCDCGALISCQHRGPACPLSPASSPSTPGAPQGRSLSLSLAARSPAARPPRVQPAPPYHVPRSGAGFRQCGLARGARETGLQAARAAPVSCRPAGTRVGGKGAPHHWQTGEGFWATGSGATGGPCGRCCRGAPVARKEAQRSKRTSEHRGGSERERAVAYWPWGQSGAAGDCSWTEACLAISDLGAGLSPRIPYQAGRESGLGVGAWNLKWGPRGSSWTEGSGAQERQIWVHEGCPGPQEWGPWADQSQVSWEVAAEGVGVLAAGRGADRVPALERESERRTPSGASWVQAPFRGPQGTRSRRTILEEGGAAPSPQGSTPVWAGVTDGLAGCPPEPGKV